MTIVWLIFFTISATITVVTIFPLFSHQSSRNKKPVSLRKNIYMDQLKELEHEFEQGLIGKPEVETSKIEISRRLLIEIERERSGAMGGKKKTEKLILGYLSVVIPTAAFGIYLIVGSPHLPALPIAERDPATDWQRDAKKNLLLLKKKLIDTPDNPNLTTCIRQSTFRL